MDFSRILIVAEALACVWCLAAACAAWTAKRHWLLTVLLSLPPLIPLIILAGFTVYWSHREFAIPVAGVIGLAVVAAIGVAFIIVQIRRGHGWSGRRAGLMGGVLLLLVVLTLHQSAQARSLERSVISSRATAAVVSLRPGMPAPADNAAIDYLILKPLCDDHELNELVYREDVKKWYHDGGAAPQDQSAILAKLAPLYSLIEGAAARSLLVMPRNQLRSLFGHALPEVSIAEFASNALAIRACTRHDAGDVRGAWQDVERMFRLASHLGQDPVILSQLVQFSMVSKAFGLTRRFALRGGAIAPGTTSRFPWDQRIVQCLIADEAMVLQVVDENESGSDELAYLFMRAETATAAGLLLDLHRVFFMPEEIAQYRRAMDRLRQSVDKGLEQAQAAAAEEVVTRRQRGLLSQLASISAVGMFSRFAEVDAMSAVMTAAILAQESYVRTGSWPVSIDPAWPLDPCTRKSLRMALDGDRLRIWSVGGDLIDDQGANMNYRTRKGDIALTIGPP